MTTREDPITDWCNDEIIPLSRKSGSVGANINRSMGLSKIKRFHILLCLLTAFSIVHLMSNGPSVIDPDNTANVVRKNTTVPANPDSSSITTASQEREASPLPTPRQSPSPTNKKGTAKPTKNPEPTSKTPVGDGSSVAIGKATIKSGNANNEIDGKSHIEPKNLTEPRPLATTIIEEKTQQQEEIENIDKSKNISSFEQNKTDETSSKEPKNEIKTASTIPPSASPTTSKLSKDKTSKNSTATTTMKGSNQLPKTLSDSDLSPIARNFAETHCDLTRVKDGWYPSGKDDWQQRAPYLIVAGVWNGGVQPLVNALLKHPQIHVAKTDGFFLPKQFSKYITVQTNEKSIANSNNQTAGASNGSSFNIKVFAARERMYAQVYSKAIYLEKTSGNSDESPVIEGNIDENNSNNKHIGMDVSPGLIFYAPKTAYSVLCTAPWVKVIVLLRNPIDRLYRQWSYSVQNLSLKLSLEDWMAQEMKLLQKVGLIGSGDEGDKEQPEEKYHTFLSEKEAWEKYQSVRSGGAIGRSLYVFQLEEWIQAYVSAGKNPPEEIIVLTTEDIEEDPEHKYAEIMRFLGLNNNKNGDESFASGLGNTLLQASDLKPMTKETRKMLQNFFRPYNKRLTELLTSNGFKGDWHKRWN